MLKILAAAWDLEKIFSPRTASLALGEPACVRLLLGSRVMTLQLLRDVMPQSGSTSHLTSAVARAYEADGAICLRGVFKDKWLELLRDGVEEALRSPGPHAEDYTPSGSEGRFFGDIGLWKRFSAFKEFAMRSPAALVAASLMGASRINLIYDQLLVKEPRTHERTPWHQDQPYWALDGNQLCSIWLPLDTVDEATCLRFVAGSHKWPQVYNPLHFKDGSGYSDTGLPQLPHIDDSGKTMRLLHWQLEPGDCLVFSGRTIHGGPGNMSDASRRRALSTRWAGDDVRYVHRPGEVAIPTEDPGIAYGAPLGGREFPLVWTRAHGFEAGSQA